MKKSRIIKMLVLSVVTILSMTSCTKELDKIEIDEDIYSSEVFYQDEASYKQFLAKLYAGLAVSGQQGPAGNSDIAGIDEGFGQYLRAYWVMNEITTDEAIIAWADGNLPSLNNHTWASNNEFIYAMFSRCMYQVSLCNEFLRQTTADKLNSRNVSAATRAQIVNFRAEARFLRAFSYWHLMDMFGNVPFTTENDAVGFSFPQQKSRAFIFDFVVSELNSIDADLLASGSNEFGRVDKIAGKMLLAKVYLNAQVYINQNKFAEASAALAPVLSSTYSINTSSSYGKVFMADNDSNGSQSEMIFPIRYSGLNTQTYGGTTFITHAAIGGSMNPANFGVNGGWFGLRTRQEFVAKFAGDPRGMFYTSGQTLSIGNIGNFGDGYAVEKYKNIKSTGGQGSDVSGNFVDIDFPVFRLADAYLMYAELAARGQGSASQAATYVNTLRTRAGGSATITAGDITLDFVLDERGRELYWEGHRRQDLIRFGKYTGSNYNWQWKGGVQAGTSIDDKFKIFPIPATAIGSNPTLQQNPGY
ncbi:RagB/SusD family nutrient uptake outer membrane protein [Flavobacterium cheonanense]|uniref:RagB/SusD family nutrient uptake outer membrane protein n=1 Tax=Flavobacterium cheonanense TaxID=706183 RepID=A0ABP7VD91_9FLAO